MDEIGNKKAWNDEHSFLFLVEIKRMQGINPSLFCLYLKMNGENTSSLKD